jgi:transcriptional regulator with XRE-family HTH domain
VPAKSQPSPFPWRCGECGQERVEPAVVPYTAKVKYNGQVHSVDIPGLPVLRCAACGVLLFNNDSNDAINRAFRGQQGLLQPEVIRQQRLARGWTQQRLAEELATAEATISRWETGTVIQTQALDKALRRCLGLDCKPTLEPLLRNNRDVFYHLAVADRETLLSGLLAWLLDPKGSHGLGEGFLKLVWRRVFPTEFPPQHALITVEDREGRDKRFDISVRNSSDGRVLVLEVKCKTNGTARQLEKYADGVVTVWRIGFAEWNWIDLDHKQQERFPLITFTQLASMMNEALRGLAHETPYRAFIEDLAAHLKEEACFFSRLEDYFFGDGSVPPPTPPPSLRDSWRFYSGLYWEWFQKQLAKNGRFPSVTWKPPKSDPTGVWFASHLKWLTPATPGWVRQLPAVESGRVEWWVHIELLEPGIVAQRADCEVGRMQLRLLSGSKAALGKMYKAVRECPTRPVAFQPPKKGPRGGYFSALTRKLTVKDFRYAALVEVLAQLLEG